jgi:hypothetical protein
MAFSAAAQTPACGTFITGDTVFDSDMVCASTALKMASPDADNKTLDCSGHSITTIGSGAAIEVSGTTGIEIKNCNITTHKESSPGISQRDANGGVITNNTINTTNTYSHGIYLWRSSNNYISYNSITTTGLSARTINIEFYSDENTVSDNSFVASNGNSLRGGFSLRIRARSNTNTVSRNLIESIGGTSLSIESSSNNQLSSNTLIGSQGYMRVGTLVIQNGGLGIDNSGNIFVVENNFGGAGGPGGEVTTLAQVNPNTGEPISYLRLVRNGADLGFGLDSLEVMPDGRFIATKGGFNKSLYEIDPVSGEVVLVPTSLPAFNGNLNGLQSVGLNTVLATTNAGELLSIDLSAGTGTIIGQDGNGWTDLAQHPTTGKLYALSRHRFETSGSNHLYEIDPATGQIIQKIGDVGVAFMSDIDFSATGILYANYGLYTLDINSGAGTYLGGFGPDPHEPLSQNNSFTDDRFTAAYSSLQFLQPVDLPPILETNISNENFRLDYNRVYVDSAVNPFLDVPARIFFENIGGTSHDLLIDPEDDGIYDSCISPQCTLVSFIDGKLVFDVAGFTTYSSEILEPSMGSVVGGGWIYSPADACYLEASCEGIAGKASFGFVSQYKRGIEIPDGNFVFHLKSGDIKFRSDNYDWLAINGYRAQFTGTGTINGEGNFGFTLATIDAELSPTEDADLLRIKIWNKDDGDRVVYDNEFGGAGAPSTEIGGGSIKIHTSN